MPASSQITLLLERAAAGEGEAREELAARVYHELESYAERQMKARYGRELVELTLEPAALVNETFLRGSRPGRAPGHTDASRMPPCCV